MKIKNLILILSLFVVCVGCGEKIKEKHDIVAVWKYGPSYYGVTLSNNSELREISFVNTGIVRIFTDVPANSNMWCQFELDTFYGYKLVHIHIHSVKDINSKVSQILEKEE